MVEIDLCATCGGLDGSTKTASGVLPVCCNRYPCHTLSAYSHITVGVWIPVGTDPEGPDTCCRACFMCCCPVRHVTLLPYAPFVLVAMIGDLWNVATCFCCCGECDHRGTCWYYKKYPDDPTYNSGRCCWVLPYLAKKDAGRRKVDTSCPGECCYALCCVGATETHFVDMGCGGCTSWPSHNGHPGPLAYNRGEAINAANSPRDAVAMAVVAGGATPDMEMVPSSAAAEAKADARAERLEGKAAAARAAANGTTASAGVAAGDVPPPPPPPPEPSAPSAPAKPADVSMDRNASPPPSSHQYGGAYAQQPPVAQYAYGGSPHGNGNGSPYAYGGAPQQYYPMAIAVSPSSSSSYGGADALPPPPPPPPAEVDARA